MLIPYIIWNFIVICLLWLTEMFIPGMMSGLKKSVVEWSETDWLYNLYTSPISYQFWFIRDLIILCILSPIIYFCIKYGRLAYIMALFFLWVFNIWYEIPGISIMGIFSFSIGAYCSIKKRIVVNVLSDHVILLGIVYGILSLLEITIQQETWLLYYHNVNMFIGMIFIVAFIAKLHLNGYKIENPILTQCSFFIFAYHVMPLVLVLKLCIRIVPVNNDVTLILIYFSSTFIVILFGILLGTFLDKYFPTLYRLISGGRNLSK